MRILLPILFLGACGAHPKEADPDQVSMRHTLSESDREIPGPVMTSRKRGDENAPTADVEMADLSEGRTYIAQGGVQVTLANLTGKAIELWFKKGEEEQVARHQGNYAEGAAFGLVYSADVSDTVYIRLETRSDPRPIDLSTAGNIAKQEINERVDCQGVDAMQSVAQDNGTVLIRAMRDGQPMCSVRVGLYTGSVISDGAITEIPKHVRPAEEIQ